MVHVLTTGHCTSATPRYAQQLATSCQTWTCKEHQRPTFSLTAHCPSATPPSVSLSIALDDATFDQLSGLDLQVTPTTAEAPLSVPDALCQVLVGPYLGPSFGSLYLQGSGWVLRNRENLYLQGSG